MYKVTKHAIVSLSESLSKQLIDAESRIGVSVLCPSLVATRIVDSAFESWTPADADQSRRASELQERVDSATNPAQISDSVFQAIRKGWLYIVPHNELKEAVKERFQAIMDAFEQQHEPEESGPRWLDRV